MMHKRLFAEMVNGSNIYTGTSPVLSVSDTKKSKNELAKPKINTGKQLSYGTNTLNASITNSILSSETSEFFELNTPSSIENQPIVVNRKIAKTRFLHSQNSKLNYFPIWSRPAERKHISRSSASSDTRNTIEKNLFVADDTPSFGYGSKIDRSVYGGSVKFLHWEMSMAEVNYNLQATEYVDFDENGDPMGDQEFSEVMGYWKFDGIINNDDGNVNLYGYDNRMNSDSLQAIYKYNHAFVFNYWGPEAINGTFLFFIYKRVDRTKLPLKPNYYVMGVTDRVTKSAIPLRSSDDNDLGAKDIGLVDKPFQIIPWARYGHTVPPLSVLEYIDNHGIKRIASYKQVGVVSKGSSKAIKAGHYNRASYDDSAAMKLPLIEIFIGERI